MRISDWSSDVCSSDLYFGNWEAEKPIRDRFKHFIVDEVKMAKTNDGVFSHCLPLRRNVKATDAVMDPAGCIALDGAENRPPWQKAVLAALCEPAPGPSGRGAMPGALLPPPPAPA